MIHAQLILPHQTFVYVHIYADSAFKGGRFAYCLATFEGARRCVQRAMQVTAGPHCDPWINFLSVSFHLAALYHVSHRLGPQALGEAVLDDALDSFGSLNDDNPTTHEPAAVSAAANDPGAAELLANASVEE